MRSIRIQIASYGLLLVAMPAHWRANAQVPAAKYEPRVGFFALFVEQDARNARIEQQRAVEPERAAGLERRVQIMMGLGPADYAVLTAVCQHTVRDLRAASEEGSQYVESLKRSGGPPDVEYLSRREDQRRQRVEAAMGELRARLSPAGWAALSKYVESEIRSRLRWKELKDAM